MVLRNIIKIDEEKCNGCGKCVAACAEGAIQMIDGKAKLVSEIYCDGLGACIGDCPVDAITIEQRQAKEFDEEAVEKHLSQDKKEDPAKGFVCPGLMSFDLGKPKKPAPSDSQNQQSQLSNWPLQLKLVSPLAPYFKNSDLLVAADCVAFAVPDFHSRFLSGKSVVVGCPKLDDSQYYIEKLAEIIKANDLNSLTVLHMEVPCCSGLVNVVAQAIALSGHKIPYKDITININGSTGETKTVQT